MGGKWRDFLFWRMRAVVHILCSISISGFERGNLAVENEALFVLSQR